MLFNVFGLISSKSRPLSVPGHRIENHNRKVSVTAIGSGCNVIRLLPHTNPFRCRHKQRDRCYQPRQNYSECPHYPSWSLVLPSLQISQLSFSSWSRSGHPLKVVMPGGVVQYIGITATWEAESANYASRYWGCPRPTACSLFPV